MVKLKRQLLSSRFRDREKGHVTQAARGPVENTPAAKSGWFHPAKNFPKKVISGEKFPNF
jgi:hypothetical protein